MKHLLSALLISSLTITSSFAATINYVEKDVALLGDLAMGYSFEKVEGKNAEEIIAHYTEMTTGEAPVYKEYEEMNDGDEVNEGLTSLKSALQMNQNAIAQIDNSLEGIDGDDAEGIKLKAKVYDLEHKWAPIIKRLGRQGVKFGYSGNGPGYCGVSFIKLLIIDEKEGKVYEVYLSESGSC